MAIFNNQFPVTYYPSCHPWISWSVGCRNPGTSSTESWMGSGSTSLTPEIAEPVLCSLCPDARGQEAQATSAKTWDVTELCFPNRGTQECFQTAKVSLVVATPTPAQRCPPANSGSGLQMRVRAAVTPRANRYGSPSSSTNRAKCSLGLECCVQKGFNFKSLLFYYLCRNYGLQEKFAVENTGVCCPVRFPRFPAV